MKVYFLGNCYVAGNLVAQKGEWKDIDEALLKKVRKSVIKESEIDPKQREQVVVPEKVDSVKLDDVNHTSEKKASKAKSKQITGAEDK